MPKKANKRAKAGSGKRHDKHGKKKPADDQDRAAPGSGAKHDKHAPTADVAEIEVETEVENWIEWTVDELKGYADENDIDLTGARNKSEIIALIEAAEMEGSDDDSEEE